MSSSSSRTRFAGLIAPVLTPLTSDGKINLSIIDRYVDLLVEKQVAGAFVCGTAGECSSLTIDERKQVLAKWTEVAKGRIKIIAHIGTNGIEDAKELARHSQEVHAAAVALVAPSYIKPDNVEAVVEFCARVAEHAPDLPFFYYHFPDITNVRFPAISVMKLASKKIPNFQGVKFTHHDFYDFGLCTEFEGGKYDVLIGYEHVLLAGLAYGTPGSIGITYSLVGNHYAKIVKSFEGGDIKKARDEHSQGVSFYAVLTKYGLIRAHKAMLRLKGYDMGPVRLPLVDLTPAEVEAMVGELKQTDLYREYYS